MVDLKKARYQYRRYLICSRVHKIISSKTSSFDLDRLPQFQVSSTADSMMQKDVKLECRENFLDYIAIEVHYSSVKEDVMKDLS